MRSLQIAFKCTQCLAIFRLINAHFPREGAEPSLKPASVPVRLPGLQICAACRWSLLPNVPFSGHKGDFFSLSFGGMAILTRPMADVPSIQNFCAYIPRLGLNANSHGQPSPHVVI